MKFILIDMKEQLKEVVFVDCVYLNKKYYCEIKKERRDAGWQVDILKTVAEENIYSLLTTEKTLEQENVSEKAKYLEEMSEMPEKR